MLICFFYMTLTRNTMSGSRIFPDYSAIALIIEEIVMFVTAASMYFYHSESWIPTFPIKVKVK